MRPLLALLTCTAVATSQGTAFAGARAPTSPMVLQVQTESLTTRAQPAEPWSRALMLTVSSDDARARPQRFEFLLCSPPRGRHPKAAEACALLRKAGGDPGNLKPDKDIVCPMVFEPVTVTASGFWDATSIWFERTYSGVCELRSMTGAIFDI